MSWRWYSTDGSSTEWPLGEPLPGGADIFNVNFVNQFRAAYNERALLVGADEATNFRGFPNVLIGPLSMLNAGDNAQFADSYAELVIAIGNLFLRQAHNGLWLKHEGAGLPTLSTLDSHAYWTPEEVAAECGVAWGVPDLNVTGGWLGAYGVAPAYSRQFSIRSPAGKTFLTRMSRVPPTSASFEGFDLKAVDSTSAIGGWFYDDLRAILNRLTVFSMGCARVKMPDSGAITKYKDTREISGHFYQDFVADWNAQLVKDNVGTPAYLAQVRVGDNSGRRFTRSSIQIHPRQVWHYPSWRSAERIAYSCYIFVDPLEGDLAQWADLEGIGLLPRSFNKTGEGMSESGAFTDLGYFGIFVCPPETPANTLFGATSIMPWRSDFDRERVGESACVLLRLVDPQYP